MPDLLVYTPTYSGGMHPECERTVRAQQCSLDWEWVIDDNDPYPYPDHRNVLAKYQRARQLALDGGYSALLTVEHDMGLPVDAFQKLWDTIAPVVYGVYMLRHGAHVLNAWQYLNNKNLGSSLSLYKQELALARQRGVQRVCGVGWGCTLIRREVLQRIPFHDGGDNPAGDLAFAKDCLAADVLMLARFDVACDHWDGDACLAADGRSIMGMVKVTALQTLNVLVGGSVLRMAAGENYEIEAQNAGELARAGYVRIEPVIRETATAEPAAEQAVLPQARRRKGAA